jgi:serine/threonine-protein kinase
MNANKRHESGTRFGSYEILRLLGMGGMASVYEARHSALGKRVAVKVLHPHLASNAVAAARFVREGRAASAIRHPNVVEVFEIGVEDKTPYLVMELLEGDDLATHLQSHGRLAVSAAVDILLPTASAVAAAHAVGVVHRDLKTRNVFLAYERRTGLRPKVVDFGISKVSHGEEDDRALTETETLLGTLDYMAPEQARSAKNASERSDQYALGVILYECLTGRKPFSGSSTYDLLHAIVTAPFATPSALGVEIEPALEAAILRAMHRAPEQRFSSVESFGRALLPFASQTLRAVWQEDFEHTESPRSGTSLASDAATLGGSVEAPGTTASLIGATLPEVARATSLARPRPRWTIAALAVGSLGVVALLAPSAVRSRGGAQPRATEAIATTEPVHSVAPDPAESATPTEPAPAHEPTEALAAAVPSVVASPAPAQRTIRPSPRPAERAARTAAATAHPPAPMQPPAPAPAASAAAPAPMAIAHPERGFNGAPIVE